MANFPSIFSRFQFFSLKPSQRRSVDHSFAVQSVAIANKIDDINQQTRPERKFYAFARENKANVLVNQQKVQTNVETGNRPEFLIF